MDLRLEKVLGYNFKDKSLMKRALTLASADGADNNQVLEFFGDAILEFLVSERIYDENKSEGELTERRKQLVSDSALTPVSEKLGLPSHLIRGAGDAAAKKCVPSAYEAMLAAIYLDGGMDEARKFVARTIDFSASAKPANYKGELQEYLQGIGQPPPEYTRAETGTPSNPRFAAYVTVNGATFSGEAESVKQAEQAAAKMALGSLKNK